jgi:FkbM family methyltransferase
LALIATTILVGGCSEEAGTGSNPAPAPAADAAKPGKRSLLEALGEHQRRTRNAPGRTGILAEEKRYSLFDEELIIRDFFQDRRGGVFVDVGCAWPIAANNTYYLEKHLDWTGIGIDALDDYAEGWKQERPNSKFFSYLVTDRSGGTGTFFKSPNTGLSSTNRDLAAGKKHGDSLELEELEIPMITLNDLLDREGIEKIDLLSMDIEGHEPKALAGFDIDRFRPDLVVVESESRAVTKYFHEHGYEEIERYILFDSINRYFQRKPGSGTESSSPPEG